MSLLAAVLSSFDDNTGKQSRTVESCRRRALEVVVDDRCCWSLADETTVISAQEDQLSSATESCGDELTDDDSIYNAVFKSLLSVSVSQDAIGASFGLGKLS